MADTREPRISSPSQKESYGLMGLGVSGPWQIEIDESPSCDRWFAQIEGLRVYLHFEIPSLEAIDQTIRFLSENKGEGHQDVAWTPCNGTLALTDNIGIQVKLIRDDEFTDRYFLAIEGNNELHIRFTLTGDDLRHLIDALRQARQDIETA